MSYKNPPSQTQWQKGQSGNPSGRKPDKHIRELARELLYSDAIDKNGNNLAISNVEIGIIKKCVAIL